MKCHGRVSAARLRVSQLIDANVSNNGLAREHAAWKRYLSGRLRGIGPHQVAALTDRVAQRVLELAKGPYAETVNRANREPLAGVEIGCGPASIVTGTGEVRVGYQYAAKALAGFYLRWLYVLFAIIRPAVRRSWQGGCVVVLGTDTSNIVRNGSDSSFIEFCRRGPIKPLNKAAVIFVQTGNNCINSGRSDFIYSSRPMLELLQSDSIRYLDRLKMVWRHLGILIQYSILCTRMPEASLIANEVCFVAPVHELDRMGRIDALVLSCALFGSQPLWMRSCTRFHVHMVWYAQNFKPVTWTENQATSDLVELTILHVHEHWVWTNSFGEYLLGFDGAAKYSAVGPILWYLPDVGCTKTDNLQVAVFDVSPYSDEVALSHGQFPNYNSPSNLTQFIDDIQEFKEYAAQQLKQELVLVLKTKRGYRSAYDREYFDMLEARAAEGLLTLLPHDEDIFRIIGSSCLVVVYPFTSPAYVAEAMNVPVMYYDPTGKIEGRYFPEVYQNVKFVSGRENLMKYGLERVSDSKYTAKFT